MSACGDALPNLVYVACPQIKNKNVWNLYSIFNLKKRHCEWIACT
jgi:hypothetical protein